MAVLHYTIMEEFMTTENILNILKKDIHSTIMATVDADGLPVTCVKVTALLSAKGWLLWTHI